MRAWPFSKPKTPGYGISRGYYLTILSTRSVLPAIAEVANPSGAGAAATGLGVPLGGSSDKSLLVEPMRLGPYAIASNDRKTVLRMLVMSKEEAAYDPEMYARSQLARDEDPEVISRLRATWTIAQLTFESHDPGVYPALDFFLGVAVRLATLTEGVIADSICERYRLPENVIETKRIHPLVDVREHVAVRFATKPDGIHAYTLGMQKFAMPEYEISGLFDEDSNGAERFLLTVCQTVLVGDVTKLGDRFGSPKALFQAADGGFDKGMWEGIPVFELLPPTSMTPGDAIRAWLEDVDR
ncbi:MAG: hypothetical protein P4L46_18525 [Fimbriimonas sp.]|nr:hypothetical protein [Fimbriimonas sp.]